MAGGLQLSSGLEGSGQVEAELFGALHPSQEWPPSVGLREHTGALIGEPVELAVRDPVAAENDGLPARGLCRGPLEKLGKVAGGDETCHPSSAWIRCIVCVSSVASLARG